jgi:hypothetical protein
MTHLLGQERGLRGRRLRTLLVGGEILEGQARARCRPATELTRQVTARKPAADTDPAAGYRLRPPASCGSSRRGVTVMPTRPMTPAFSMRQNRWSMTLRTSNGRLMSMAAGEWSRLW